MERGLMSDDFWMTTKQKKRAIAAGQEEEDLRLGKYKGIYCFRCLREGHYAIVCPDRIKRKKKKSIRKDIFCFKCKKQGHFVHKCPMTKKKPRDPQKGKKCYRCKEVGHAVKDCHLKKGEKPTKAASTSNEGGQGSVTVIKENGEIWKGGHQGDNIIWTKVPKLGEFTLEMESEKDM